MSGTTEGAELEGVEVAGPADGKPIVFVHGVIWTRKHWVPHREALREEFRFVAMDLPGHGDHAEEDFQLDVAVERLDEVIEQEGGGRAAVVGLSLGGYVATEYARQYPDKVESLVISGSSANLTGVLDAFTRGVSHVYELARKSDLVERGVTWLHVKFTEAQDLDPETEKEILEDGFYPDQFGKAGFEIAGQDFRQAFGSYTGPALVLNGKWDVLNRLGEKKHAAVADDASVAVIKGTGHVCTLERPGAYSNAVRQFVTSPEEPLARTEGA